MVWDRALTPLLVAVMFGAGCGSSPDVNNKAVLGAVRAKARYAEDQSTAIGVVDSATREVLDLNPAPTGSAVLGQKLLSLSAAAVTAARSISELHPPQGAAILQQREVTQLRQLAQTLNDWVKAHPKRTVADANGLVHRARDPLDRTLEALIRIGYIN